MLGRVTERRRRPRRRRRNRSSAGGVSKTDVIEQASIWRISRDLSRRDRLPVYALVAGSLLLSPGAAAKNFTPGDLNLCNASRCLEISSQPVLNSIAAFYYESAKPPARVRGPGPGAPFFRLEFSNRYVTGIVAGAKLDRFLSYGVNLGRFQAKVWYRVPIRGAAGLRRLSEALAPLRLRPAHHRHAGTISAPGRHAVAIKSSVRTPPPSGPRPATTTGHRRGLTWALASGALAALIVGAFVAKRRRRSFGAEPKPRTR